MFEFVVFLMMLFQVAIIGFAVFCLRLTKKTDIKDISVFLEKFILFSRTLPYLHYKVSHVSGRHLHNEGSSSRQ